jgi:hypothetical protein
VSADTASGAGVKPARTSNHHDGGVRSWWLRQREGRPLGIGVAACIATMAVLVNFPVPWWLFLVEVVVALLVGVGAARLTGIIQHRHRRK